MSSFELLQDVYLSFLERFLERILYKISPSSSSVYKQSKKFFALCLNTFELVMLLSGYGIKLRYVHHSSQFLPLDKSPQGPQGLVYLLPAELGILWSPPSLPDPGGSLNLILLPLSNSIKYVILLSRRLFRLFSLQVDTLVGG